MRKSVKNYKRYDSTDILHPSAHFILAHLCVKDSNSIEEPVGHYKQQH